MALALGRHDIGQLAEELSPEGLDAWQAYYECEPWDLQRIVLQGPDKPQQTAEEQMRLLGYGDNR